MKRFLSKLMVAVMVAGSTVALTAVSFDAEARRIGGGASSGKQSTNVMQQRQAVQPPAAAATAPTAGAAAAGAKAGGSRWLGPLAGIAAGLGLAALLSHFGLGGALADLLVIALIAGIAVFAIAFVMRALRGGGLKPAEQAAAGNAMRRDSYQQAAPERSAVASLGGAGTAAAEPKVGDWFIPADFDQQTFLQEAKKQFVAIQQIWESADLDGLRERLTDEYYAEFAPQLVGRQGTVKTDVVMLNADLMGVEKVAGGYLASVRFSGMIREDDDVEAKHFEEVWNLYKPNGQGWLLAGIQQLPGA